MKIKISYKNITVEIDATEGELIKTVKELSPIYLKYKLKDYGRRLKQ